MKKELMDILVCPVCRGDLELAVEKENGKEVITGSLHCVKCNLRYPIVDAIPNLLPPELRG
ncbi:MAG: Trm112 family protein [Chloroflexi bacterium]|nr:Trm112 family protein [Chloroflexota bacterium]